MGFWWFTNKQYHTTMTFNQVWCVRSPFYEPVHDKIIFSSSTWKPSPPHKNSRVHIICDRRDGTVSENIYFKFVVNAMWEPVPGSTLMKLCPLAPPFETVPSGAKRRARAQFQRRSRAHFQRVSWLPYCMKVKKWYTTNTDHQSGPHVVISKDWHVTEYLRYSLNILPINMLNTNL